MEEVEIDYEKEMIKKQKKKRMFYIREKKLVAFSEKEANIWI